MNSVCNKIVYGLCTFAAENKYIHVLIHYHILSMPANKNVETRYKIAV